MAGSASFLTQMTGQVIRDVTLNDFTWVFAFEHGVSITTEGFWRIVRAGRVVLAVRDHNQPFEERSPLDAAVMARGLLAEPVTSAEILDAGDLCVSLKSGTRLELLVDSSAYEGWQLNVGGPSPNRLISLGGGVLSIL